MDRSFRGPAAGRAEDRSGRRSAPRELASHCVATGTMPARGDVRGHKTARQKVDEVADDVRTQRAIANLPVVRGYAETRQRAKSLGRASSSQHSSVFPIGFNMGRFLTTKRRAKPDLIMSFAFSIPPSLMHGGRDQVGSMTEARKPPSGRLQLASICHSAWRKEIDPPRVLRLDLSLTRSNFGQSRAQEMAAASGTACCPYSTLRADMTSSFIGRGRARTQSQRIRPP